MPYLQGAQSIVEQFFSSAIAECLIAIPIYFLTVLSHYKKILSSSIWKHFILVKECHGKSK